MTADEKPQMTADEQQGLNAVTGKVIGAAIRVSSVLGAGFLEKVYENALIVELRKLDLAVKQQHGIEVRYEREIVGTYVTDLLVNGRVVVEIKAVAALDATHHSQCVNYLKATGFPLCLLFNFGKARMETKRIVWNFRRSAAICGVHLRPFAFPALRPPHSSSTAIRAARRTRNIPISPFQRK